MLRTGNRVNLGNLGNLGNRGNRGYSGKFVVLKYVIFLTFKPKIIIYSCSNYNFIFINL